MVESRVEGDLIFRGATPRPGNIVPTSPPPTSPPPPPPLFFIPLLLCYESNLLHALDSSPDQSDFSGSNTVFYDTNLSSVTPDVQAGPSGDLDKANFMFGDATESISDSSLMPDLAKSSKKRPSRPTSHNRSPNTRHSISHNYSASSGDAHSSRFQGSPIQHYPVPYNQRTGFAQYTMPTQPPLAVEHTSPPPFTYPHAYHHPGLPDTGMISPTIHASYQPMLQPHTSVYQYQHHASDGASGQFSTGGTPSLYPHHVTPPHLITPPHHTPPPPSSNGQTGTHSPSYIGSGHFHSLRYSPISTSPYAYSPQPYPTPPPVYSTQYMPNHYPQHFGSPPEPDRQGTWWFLPHSGPLTSQQQQYDNTPGSYQARYPMPYSMIAHHEMDPSYSAGGPSSPATSLGYPISPVRPAIQPVPDQQPTSSLPRDPGPNSPTGTSISGRPPPPPSEKPLVRRSYHPNPPAHRSEWVMWAGNVPSDATHDELWRFFNQPAEVDQPSESSALSGVSSIFLIARSNCAFINYDSEVHLTEAIQRFHGKALRPSDARCPRLVCRVRKKDDDLKAGVGGQRGIGIHTRWIKEFNKGRGAESSEVSDASIDDRPSTSSSDQMATGVASLSISSDDDEGRRIHPANHTSSSGSYSSTNSSLLSRYFPQRYFILKSWTQFDLDLSVEKGLWATQKHNEMILDRAYRTSQDVYLIFSVNKSREFYGYAKMVGSIHQGEHRVSWATRTADSSTSSQSSLSPVAGRAGVPPRIPEERSPESPAPMFFSPGSNRLVDESPVPAADGSSLGPGQVDRYFITSSGAGAGAATSIVPRGNKVGPQSAPAELGTIHQKLTMRTPGKTYSLDHRLGRAPPAADDFELDPDAPIRAMRSRESTGSQEQGSGKGLTTKLQVVAEEEEKGEEERSRDVAKEGVIEGEETRGEVWGESFKIEWLCTTKLSFQRTRHLRNPWNHDREIKVSRDGTELEPSVGKRLLEEWVRLAEDPSSPIVPSAKVGLSKRGSKSAPSTMVTTTTSTPMQKGGEMGGGSQRPLS